MTDFLAKTVLTEAGLLAGVLLIGLIAIWWEKRKLTERLIKAFENDAAATAKLVASLKELSEWIERVDNRIIGMKQ